MTEPAWSDLETKGFLVVPSFLGQQEIEALRKDFETGPPPDAFPFGFKLVGKAGLDGAWPKLASALERLCAETSLKVDMLAFTTFSHYIVTEHAQRTSYWHQDFDFDYRLTGDHENYLNFYLPIEKPERERSNLSVVPFDSLRARSQAAFERLRGSGGNRLIPEGGRTAVYGNYGAILEDAGDDNRTMVFDFDIDELAVTPHLGVGDLLLMRGDLVHKTQDAATKRRSASLRVTHSKKKILRERVPGSSEKEGAALAKLCATLERCFERRGQPSITVEDFVSFATGRRIDDLPLKL